MNVIFSQNQVLIIVDKYSLYCKLRRAYKVEEFTFPLRSDDKLGACAQYLLGRTCKRLERLHADMVWPGILRMGTSLACKYCALVQFYNHQDLDTICPHFYHYTRSESLVDS